MKTHCVTRHDRFRWVIFLGVALLVSTTGLLAQPPAPTQTSVANDAWVDVPASLLEELEPRGVMLHLMVIDPVSDEITDWLERLLSVDRQSAWLMQCILRDSVSSWIDHSWVREPDDQNVTWQFAVAPAHHAMMVADLHARAEAYLTPEQRVLFDALCFIEFRNFFGASAINLKEDQGRIAMQLEATGGSIVLGDPAQNPHCFLMQMVTRGRKEKPRPRKGHESTSIEPPFKSKDGTRLPGSLLQRYSWKWGWITEEFSLSENSKRALTAEQAALVTKATTQFILEARAHERSLAKYERQADGSLRITVDPSTNPSPPPDIAVLEKELAQIVGKDSPLYFVLAAPITKNVQELFPFLSKKAKHITWSARENGGAPSFELKLEGDSFPSKSNHVPDVQKHLLKGH